jgi:lipopolysaccharide export system permease protein
VVLINGTRQEIDRKKNRLSFAKFEKHSLDLNTTGKEAGGGRKKKPPEMFLWELFDPANQGARKAKLVAEGHARLTSPLLAIDFVIITLAILLAGDFSRRGQAGSIQISIGCVVAIQTFAMAMRNLSNQGTFGIPFMYATVLLPVIVGLVLLSRKRRRLGGRTAPAGPS